MVSILSDNHRLSEVVSLLKDERCNYSNFLRGSGERNPLQDAGSNFRENESWQPRRILLFLSHRLVCANALIRQAQNWSQSMLLNTATTSGS